MCVWWTCKNRNLSFVLDIKFDRLLWFNWGWTHKVKTYQYLIYLVKNASFYVHLSYKYFFLWCVGLIAVAVCEWWTYSTHHIAHIIHIPHFIFIWSVSAFVLTKSKCECKRWGNPSVPLLACCAIRHANCLAPPSNIKWISWQTLSCLRKFRLKKLLRK